MKLYPYLFTPDLDNPEIVHVAHDLSSVVSDIHITWELNGGVKSADMTFSFDPAYSYYFYNKYLGYRVLIFDCHIDIPIVDGFITSIKLVNGGVYVIVNGHWFRHSDSLYNFDDLARLTLEGAPSYTTEGADSSFTDSGQTFTGYDESGGNAQYEIWIVNSDNTITWGFIDTVVSPTEVTIYQEYNLLTTGWNGTDPLGKTATSYEVIVCYDYKTTSEIVIDALTNNASAISDDYSNIDETNTPIVYWEPPIDEGGMYPAELIDKLASLSDSSNAQWNYWIQNMPLVTLVPQKPVAHFAAQVDDGTFDWAIERRMVSGDITPERNIQELRNAVRVIYSDMEDGETTIEPTSGWTQDTDSQSKYWTREAVLSGGDSYEDIAAQYGGMYLNKYKDAVFSNSFKVTSRWIIDGAGNKVPLWYPIKYNGSYFKFVDLYPDYSLLSTSLDRKRVSQAMTMEYSADSNELRVVLDSEDNRVDALLARIDTFR